MKNSTFLFGAFKGSFAQLFLVLLTFLFSVNGVWGQNASTYAFSQSSGTYTPLVTPTVLGSGSSLDDVTYNITSSSLSGFVFNFAGTNYSAFTVSSNGFIGLGSSLMGSNKYSPLSQSTGGNVFVAAYADDLQGLDANTQISWKLEGSSPNRELVVEYKNIRNYNKVGCDVSFQIRLIETSNVIKVIYGTMTYTSTTSDAVQIGIKSSTTAGHYSNRTTTTNWNLTSAGTTNTSSCTVLNTVTMPSQGLTFTWSPPAPCQSPTDQPTNLTFSSISNTSISCSFTAAASAPSGYLVVRSTSATPPTPVDGTTYSSGSTTFGTGTSVVQASSSTSFTNSSLTGNTTYYYYIFSYNSTSCSGGPKYLSASPLSMSTTTCASAPSVSAATSISATGFTANWSTSSGGASSYLLYVASDNSFSNIVTGYNGVDVGNVTSYAVTGLSASTSYYYRLVAVGSSCNSANSSSITAITSCLPETAPTQVQDFSTFTGAAPAPICWSEASGALTSSVTLSGTTSNWLKKSNGFANANSSNVGASINLWSNSNNWLISNEIDLGNTVGLYQLKYKYAVTSYNGTSSVSTLSSHKVDVVVSTDGGATWSNTNIIKSYAGSGTYSNTGAFETVLLSQYSGVVKIAFVATCISSSDIDFHIDDVQIELVPTCIPPTSLTTSNISYQTATIGWTAPSTGTTPSNFDYEVRTSGAAGSGATGLITSGTVSTTSANITGLTSSTTYSYYVRSSCGNGDYSSWSVAGTFTTLTIEPTNQITELTAGTVTVSAIPLSWTAAATGSQAPDGYLVKASSIALNSITDPVDGTDPSDVTAFTSNLANKKQTSGTATSTTSFTGMIAGAMYHYKVYSYTNSGAAIDFKTDAPATLSHATRPNQISSTLSNPSITSNTIGFTFSSTNYLSGSNEYIIFAKAGSAITTGTPALNLSNYTANATFGSGTAYEADASAFCVHKGDGTTINLTGLNPNTTYHFLIYAVVEAPNSNGSYSYSTGTTVNRTTLQVPASLPYSDDFSTNNFIFIGTQTNKWAYGSAVGNPGSSIYVSNNNGTSNAYTNNLSVAHAYRDIAIPSGATIAQFSFNWLGNAESCCDYTRIWLVPTSFIPSAGSQITPGSGRIQVAGNFNLQTTWQTYNNNSLDVSSFANTTMRLVFEWRNDGSIGNNPPGAIDNVALMIPPHTWTGGTSTAWNTTTNWDLQTVPTSTDNVIIPSTGITNFPEVANLTIDANTTITIQSGAKLDVTGTLTNNGTLTLESGATLVQEASSTLAGTGTYNVKQDITGSNSGSAPDGRFWYLGSPVSLASSSVYFGNAANVVKKRDEVNNAWTALSSGSPESLVVGRGYYTQAMGNATINFTGGLLNNGAITIGNLSRTAGQVSEGFNLVSNPYPSYLDWDAVTKTDVGNTMWYRTASGSTAGSMVFDTYVAGTNGIGTNLNGAGVSNLVPPMQSFWVRVNANANSSLNNTGSLGLTNAMRAHFTSINGSVAGLKSTSNERDLFLRMNLLQANKKDQIIVYVNDHATNGFDQFDGEKMMQASMPQFYTSAAGKKITINGLNSAKKQQALPITMELPTTGVHSFVIEDLEIDNGLVWLEDKQEEIMQALEPGTVYEFYANSGINAERFVLHFQLIDNTTPINIYNEVNSSANFSGKGASVHAEAAGVVVIKLPATTEGITDIQIRDAAGRLVYTGATNALETIVQLEQSNGIYYVTLNSASGVEVRKVFIQQ